MTDTHVRANTQSLGEIMDDDGVINTKSWRLIRELNSGSDELLDSPALVGGSRSYTYRQMFRMWDRYAEVFSALGMTGANHARVLLYGTSSVEPLISLYALNMCGASVSIFSLMDLFDTKSLESMVAEEHITDIVLPDFVVPRDFLRFLMSKREQMGIRNIVILRTNLAGPFTPRIVVSYATMQREGLRRLPGAQLMDELLVRHAGHPIHYGTQPDDAAFVVHTSGTTKGIHKPVPLSDIGINEAARRILRHERWSFLHHNMRMLVGMELSATYALVNMVHLPLVAGGTVFTLFLDSLNPRFLDAVKYYDLNALLSTPFALDALDTCQADLSGVDVVFVGGAYVSPAAKRRHDATMRRCGAKTGISIGYGLSEAGGACIVAQDDRTDDAMGYPLPGVKIKIFDEDEGVFYNLDDGPRTGVLFINSPSVSSGRIDGKTYFSIDEVEGEPYLNTFDLVRVNEDGSLTHAGRMNRFFVNNEGIRFDAGLVEGAISAQSQIRACAIAPHYDKTIHDTVPVLHVQVEGPKKAAPDIVRDALVKVFVVDGAFQKTNLPAQCVLMDTIPRNAMGKVDVHAMQSGGKGARFLVTPVREDGRLVDVRLNRSGDAMMLQAGLPDELDQMELTYAQMVLWFIPGAHDWYTTGNTQQKRKALERGVTSMKQFAQQMNPTQAPQGMVFPMPPFQMPFGSQDPSAQQAMPQFQMPFGQQAPSAQQAMPQCQMPFGPQDPSAQQAMPQFQMPFGQQATPSFIPVFPFSQAPGTQTPQQTPGAQQQPMPTVPFVAPFFGQPAPNGPNPAQQGAQPPFAPAPQPYELYENALKNAIALLQNMLAQSEAARAATQPKADSQADQPDQDGEDGQAPSDDAQPATPAAFMPGFGCQQIPMPAQPMQQAPGVGMLPTNNYLGSLLGSLFGSTNTDYFYED